MFSNKVFNTYIFNNIRYGHTRRFIHNTINNSRHQSIRLKKIESNSSNKQVNILNNEKAAITIADILSDKINIKNKNSVIFDTYPGYGYVTQKLLKNGANRIIVWEPREKYWEDLGVSLFINN